MKQTLKKNNIAIYFILTSLIVLSNYILYNTTIAQPLPSGIALGSIIDFLVVIPVLTYFFIIRKKYSLKYIGFVILAGYGAAYLIIPKNMLGEYSFVPYIIGISEGLLLLVELFILFKVVTVLPKVIREYKNIKNDSSYFLYHVRSSVEKHLSNNRLIYVFLSELTMFYYALFCWKKKVKIPEGKPFTYHKKTSVMAVYIMLIHATVLESVGLHYVLHQWNEIAAYILLFLNVYAILFFIGEIQATRLTPFLLKEDELYLQVGLSSSLTLPIKNIKEIKFYDGPEKISKKELETIYDARVLDFMKEKPMFEIILKETETLNLMYGITRKVDRVFLNVDEGNEFFEEMQARIIQE